MPEFARKIILWQRRHGRHGLPWQGTRDPYRIWLSEIMLQQTQVAAVIPYYERFLARFPDIGALASASEDEVLQLWSGLGYYARGRNLLRAARKLLAAGKFPDTLEQIAELPGVGPSSAAAIAAFAFGRRAAILDGNVKRVLARHAGIEGFPGVALVDKKLWHEAEARLPTSDDEIVAYTQGLMDLGATICSRSDPRCLLCPVADDCVALASGRVNDIPAPRPSKVLPQRTQRYLLFEPRRPGAFGEATEPRDLGRAVVSS